MIVERRLGPNQARGPQHARFSRAGVESRFWLDWVEKPSPAHKKFVVDTTPNLRRGPEVPLSNRHCHFAALVRAGRARGCAFISRDLQKAAAAQDREQLSGRAFSVISP